MIAVGLGPGDWDGVPIATVSILLAKDTTVVVRTLHHPAAAALAELREVVSCDDLYESSDSFEDVYQRVVARVLSYADPVVYAVPGTPSVGEFAVGGLREACEGLGRTFELIPAVSFLDAVFEVLRLDPFRDGFQLLNGHEMPSPLVIDKPTVIGHLDRPLVLSDVCSRLDRVMGEDAEVVLLVDAGSSTGRTFNGHPSEIDPELAGLRTSMFVAAQPAGLVGVVAAMDRLRRECPWDREQTHETLVRYLIEESHELIDAISALGQDEARGGAYADVEEELGDVLLQVLFHAAIADEAGVFDIDDVGEQLRRKLVRRHPHVFGDTEVSDAAGVKANWEAIKAAEKGVTPASALQGVGTSLSGLSRAAEVQRRVAQVGFDWDTIEPVFGKVREELGEVEVELGDGETGRNDERVSAELGDLLFSVVNLARHLGVDAEIAIRTATRRFEDRFRKVEAMRSLEGLTLQQLDALWDEVKLSEPNA